MFLESLLLIITLFSGDIPLHINIRETSDSGKPIVVSQPDSPQVILVTQENDQKNSWLQSFNSLYKFSPSV